MIRLEQRRHGRHACRILAFYRLGTLCLLGLALWSSPLCAQAAPDTAAAAPPSGAGEQTPIGSGSATADTPAAARVTGVTTWDFVRMLLVLAVVVAAIYLLFRLLRKSGRKGSVENDLITVLGSRSLAPNRSLHLVRVGRSVYLVGSGESGVGLVSEISDRESADDLILQAAKQRPAGKRSFSEILGTILPQGGGGKIALPEGLGFLRRQKERLRKL